MKPRAIRYNVVPVRIPAQIVDADSFIEIGLHHLHMAWDEDEESFDPEYLGKVLVNLECARNELATLAENEQAKVDAEDEEAEASEAETASAVTNAAPETVHPVALADAKYGLEGARKAVAHAWELRGVPDIQARFLMTAAAEIQKALDALNGEPAAIDIAAALACEEVKVAS